MRVKIANNFFMRSWRNLGLSLKTSYLMNCMKSHSRRKTKWKKMMLWILSWCSRLNQKNMCQLPEVTTYIWCIILPTLKIHTIWFPLSSSPKMMRFAGMKMNLDAAIEWMPARSLENLNMQALNQQILTIQKCQSRNYQVHNCPNQCSCRQELEPKKLQVNLEIE